MATQKTSKLRILVGDDQIGLIGSPSNLTFMDNYKDIANFDFETDPDITIERARVERYDAIISDLAYAEQRTAGYRVLDAIKDLVPIRILHSGESNEAIQEGYRHGATHCIQKGIMPEELEKILQEN